ncbi:CHAD domain-containing protein [Microvirga sp. GCM10011540]|uniref:CYTH and CHAD domain-containing protein n=1 Tax=Microvirga sp. GCM10011540 TaxID=3317338 RepID=UPI00361EAB18
MSVSKGAAGGSPKDGGAPREIELKLEVASGETSRLLEHPLLAQAQPDPEQSGQLHAVYFDTPDLALRHAGLSLRVRRRNGRHVQTIKAEHGARGLALDRSEWESPVEDSAIDFDAATGTPLAPFAADEALRGSIKPAFSIETERRAFMVRHDAALVELALDDAKARAGSQTLRFAELELELKEGDPSSLFTLALNLSEAVPLRLAPVTKSERGYGLLDRAAPQPARADKIGMDPDASCAEAFQVVARSCLSQMVLNEAVLRRTRDPESVHQMRVGIRRLRAAMSLFKDLLGGPQTEAVTQDLRWMGRCLGPARDLDVLLERLSDPDGPDLPEDQREEIEAHRARAYEALMEALESPRFMQAILKVAAWIEAGEWLSDDSPTSRPARDHARKELSRRWKKIRRQAGHLADLDDEGRHRLRIRIKKLRYGSEFFAPLFTSGGVKRRRKAMLSALERLQDLLGAMNDIAVGSSLIPSLAEQDPDHARRRMKKLLSKADAAGRDLPALKPFWK